MKFLFAFLVMSPFLSIAQLSVEESELMARMTPTSTIPAELVSARSVVVYQNTFTVKELQEAHTFFQQTGIDAVAYFDVGRLLAGHESRKAYSANLLARGIKYLILFQKNEKGYRFIFCPFNGKPDFVENNSLVWQQENASLNELLKTVYRFAVSNLKKTNFLINDLPETNLTVNVFKGRINQNFSLQVKTFKTAIPRFGNAVADAELEAYLKENFPVKYELVDPQADEVALSAKGFRTILRYVHTRGLLAQEILGFDMTQQARSLPSAIVVNNEIQIKTILAEQPVYKFFFKNLEYGDLFLGTKWDADVTWQDALRNHIEALKLNQQIGPGNK
ncbi:MAG: hypothetical protein HOP37_04770 [Cyclobacteriaceae bacterium]|nr:hypothetical protein [Cyclobacteriaceae bacterium]